MWTPTCTDIILVSHRDATYSTCKYFRRYASVSDIPSSTYSPYSTLITFFPIYTLFTMPVAAVTTSAGKLFISEFVEKKADETAGSLNLLEDEDKEIRGYALNHLLTIVPQFWAEISEKISWL